MAAGPLTGISAEPSRAEPHHRDRRAERRRPRQRLATRRLLGGEAAADPGLQRRSEPLVEPAAQAAIVGDLVAVAALRVERVGEELGELLATELRVERVPGQLGRLVGGRRKSGAARLDQGLPRAARELVLELAHALVD